jgi:hypothetical protein
MRISHAWLGDYSALYLELGALKDNTATRRDGAKRNPRGEVTVYAGFQWRIEREHSIVGGSGSSPETVESITAGLVGRTISSASTWGRLPELFLDLSDDHFLLTSATSESQPEWTVSFTGRCAGHLGVEGGRICHDTRSS